MTNCLKHAHLACLFPSNVWFSITVIWSVRLLIIYRAHCNTWSNIIVQVANSFYIIIFFWFLKYSWEWWSQFITQQCWILYTALPMLLWPRTHDSLVRIELVFIIFCRQSPNTIQQPPTRANKVGSCRVCLYIVL